VYQEILFELRPKLIVELGSWLGGSALFFASMLGFIGEGKVVSVDVEDRARPNHARIQYLIGSSTSTEVITRIEEIAHEAGPPVIVIADSDHRRVHVAKELEAYASLVTVGSYVVVEDTNINGHPVLEGWGEGPREAVLEFLSRHPEFEPDYQREKLFLSFNPGGYLRRLL
jgi:cephalosporin hydroxylase